MCYFIFFELLFVLLSRSHEDMSLKMIDFIADTHYIDIEPECLKKTKVVSFFFFKSLLVFLTFTINNQMPLCTRWPHIVLSHDWQHLISCNFVLALSSVWRFVYVIYFSVLFAGDGNCWHWTCFSEGNPSEQ